MWALATNRYCGRAESGVSLTSSKATRPMLSRSITRFNMSEEPAELAIANLLNSTRYSLTNWNLWKDQHSLYTSDNEIHQYCSPDKEHRTP